MTDDDSPPHVNRRRLLKITSAAAVGSTTLTGAASANPGQGRGQGQGQGPPFLEPTTDLVNFCGCTSVCLGDLPGCNDVEIHYTDGTSEVVQDAGDYEDRDRVCYDRGNIEYVKAGIESGNITTYCNPNTACAGTSEDQCDEVGTAPQLEGGSGCGD